MNKISAFIDTLSEEELGFFEKEMKEGYIQKYIDIKKEFFKVKDKCCPVCGSSVEADCYMLVWGEPSIRKRAHFCGKDCLQYFLNRNSLPKNKNNDSSTEENKKLKEKNATSKTKTSL